MYSPSINDTASRLLSQKYLLSFDQYVVSAVGAFVHWQLQVESRTMDRMFAQYQSAQSEASRQMVFKDTGRADPRKSVFNVLSWGKFQEQ